MQKDLTTKILAVNGAETKKPDGEALTVKDLISIILVGDFHGYRSNPAESSARFKLALKVEAAQHNIDLIDTELTLIKKLAAQFLTVTEAGRIEQWADA